MPVKCTRRKLIFLCLFSSYRVKGKNSYLQDVWKDDKKYLLLMKGELLISVQRLCIYRQPLHGFAPVLVDGTIPLKQLYNNQRHIQLVAQNEKRESRGLKMDRSICYFLVSLFIIVKTQPISFNFIKDVNAVVGRLHW